MKCARWAVVSLQVGLCLAAPLSACEWDYDTLQLERQRFPSALELVTGKFSRHTPEFYYCESRIASGGLPKRPTTWLCTMTWPSPSTKRASKTRPSRRS